MIHILGFEKGGKAPNAMIMLRFLSEIPSAKPVDVAKPENRPSMLCLYIPFCPPNIPESPVET
jgi:hypothetical protein